MAVVTAAHMPRLSPEEVSRTAALTPLRQDETPPELLLVFGTAFDFILGEQLARKATWPDGSVGYLVLHEGQQEERLQRAYTLARTLLEEKALHEGSTGALPQ